MRPGYSYAIPDPASTLRFDRLTPALWNEQPRSGLLNPQRGVAQSGLERLHGVQKVASSNLVAPIAA